MKRILLGVVISVFIFACSDEKKDDATVASETKSDDKKTTDELLDMSETEGVRKSFDAFSKGDIDGFTAGLDDNVRFLWSSGDSLVGKQAVKDYYNARWKLIDSLHFSDHILVPIRANLKQSEHAPTGKWVLHWTFAHVKYKNGKKLDFWVHNVNHYNDAGKVDFLGQYLDRGPLMEATKDMVK